MSRVLSNELARLDSRDSHPSFVVLLHSFMCGHIVISEDWFCCAESALCFAQTSLRTSSNGSSDAKVAKRKQTNPLDHMLQLLVECFSPIVPATIQRVVSD